MSRASTELPINQHEEFLAAMEELGDLRAFDEAMAEEGDNIPWEQVKADLGWT